MPNDEGPAKRGALLTDVGIPMAVVEGVWCAGIQRTFNEELPRIENRALGRASVLTNLGTKLRLT
jgi:hypothetical protein